MDPSILVTVVVFSAGCLLATAITKPQGVGRLERLAIAFAWGPGLIAGVVSLIGFFGLAVGLGRPGRMFLVVLLLLAGGAGLWAAHRRRRPPLSRLAEDRTSGNGLWFGLVGFAGLAVGYVWTFLHWLSASPLGSWDAMGIWTYRAIQWFRAGDAFPETVALLLEGKPGYPLLLPGLITSQYTLWGRETVVIPGATGWFFVIGLTAVIVLAVRRWTTTPMALAAAALVLSTPVIWLAAFAQGADLALAYLTVAAAFGLSDLTRASGRPVAPAWLVGFFLGSMVWTKNEGAILAAVLVAATILIARLDQRRPPVGSMVGLVVGALPGVAATIAFKQLWVAIPEVSRFVGHGMVDRLLDPDRWWVVASAFAERLIPGSNDGLWGGTVVVLFLVLVIAVTREGRRASGWAPWIYAATVTTILVAWVVVYLATPDPLDWHLNTSLDRLLIQILPTATVGFFALLADR